VRSSWAGRMVRWPVLLAGLLCMAAGAADQPRYNQVRLQASQSEMVLNDTMHVSLEAFAEAQEPAAVARQINSDMEWALPLAKAAEGITVRTGNYQTYPVLHKNETRGWRGQQDLELEGLDTQRLGDLAGRLQERLQVKAIYFSVSDRQREATENRLIGRALQAFRERAGLVGDNLKATGYRIVDLGVDTSSQRPPVPVQARMSALAAEAAIPVAVEAGESRVTVTVSGTIELQLP